MERPFLSFLIENRAVSKESLEKVVPSNGSGENLSIEGLLVTSGLMTEEELRSSIEQFYGVPMASLRDFPQEPLLINSLSIQFMKEAKFIPARLTDNELTVIMSNPLDFYTLDAIRLATGHEIRALYGKEEGILFAIEQYYGSGLPSMERIIEDIDSASSYQGEDEENIDHLRDMASEGPVIRLVNLIITRAIETRASDIHFEPFEDLFRVRYRIDGVLHDVESMPKRLQAAIDLPCQDHGKIEHRREASPPGRQNHAPGERERDRLSGVHSSYDPWGEYCPPNFRQRQHCPRC